MITVHKHPHPGEVLKEYLRDVTIQDAADALGVTRAALSRVVNCRAGISADMALRLAALLGTSPDMWINMQAGYELWKASQHERPTIKPLRPAAAF